MKKIFFLCAIFLCANANAETYFGMGYNEAKIGYNKSDVVLSDGTTLQDVEKDDFFNKKSNGINAYFGYKDTNNFGFEIGYTKFLKANKSNEDVGLIWYDSRNKVQVNTKTELDIIDLTTNYTYIMGKIELMGGGGPSIIFSKLSADFKDNNLIRLTYSENESGFGMNIKAGLGYRITEKVTLRFDGGFLKTSLKTVDDIYTYGLSCKYIF